MLSIQDNFVQGPNIPPSSCASGSRDGKKPISFDSKADSGLEISIETLRLRMRSFNSSDMPNSIGLYGDAEVVTFFDHGLPRSMEEVMALVNEISMKKMDKMSPFGLFSAFTKEENKFVGHFDIMPGENPGEVEIGYILCKKFHGQGYGTEIAFAIVEYAKEITQRGYTVDKSPITSLIASVHPENIGSMKILEKIGMQCIREGVRFGGLPRKYYARCI